MHFSITMGSWQTSGALTGFTFSNANGINRSGTVVGNVSAWTTKEFGGAGFHLLVTASLTSLGTLGDPESQALAINQAGVIVGSSGRPATSAQRAFVLRGGVMTNLNTLVIPPGSPVRCPGNQHFRPDRG